MHKLGNGLFGTCVVLGRVRPDPRKIESIKEWKNLALAKGVRLFLGLANFYKKFIKDFFALAKPFNNLSKKKGSFEWKDKQQSAFDLLKGKLLSTSVLRFLNFVKPFEVHMNINDFVVGEVLMEKGHPIAFQNKKLARAQLRWPTHEKELFMVVSCLKAWQH